MAWFDILANVGSAAEQSTANFQRLLLQQRELQERQRQQEEERRRWEASERRAALADQRAAEEAARAAAAEGRATRQFELGLKRERAQQVEKELRQYGADPIPQDVIERLAAEDSTTLKNLVRKNQETGEWRLRMGPKEELEAIVSKRQSALLTTPENEIAKLPVSSRKELARLQGLDEQALLTPQEIDAEIKNSPQYRINEMIAKMNLARAYATTPAQMATANRDYDLQYRALDESYRKTEAELRQALEARLDAELAEGEKGKGRAVLAQTRKNQGEAAANALLLGVLNMVRTEAGLEPTQNPQEPFRFARPQYERPFGKVSPGTSPTAGRATPGLGLTPITLPNGQIAFQRIGQ